MEDLSGLFTAHPHLQAVIGMVLTGRGGFVVTADDSFRAVRLNHGCYAIPGGDPTAPEARAVISAMATPRELVIPDDERWRQLIHEVWGDRATDRSMRSYLPGPELAQRCEAHAVAIPAGYDLQPMDETLAARMGPDLAPHGVAVLGGPEHYVKQAPGQVLSCDGTVACAATIYALTDTCAEIAIATHPDHRQRGLAACAAAALVQDCLERGLEPHWNAFNPVSQRLAERLGFEFVGMCEILMLAGEDGMQPDGA